MIATGSPYGLYAKVPFNVITKTDGDVYAGSCRYGWVKVAESIALINIEAVAARRFAALHCGELAYKTDWQLGDQRISVTLICHWLMLDADRCIELFARSKASYLLAARRAIAVYGDVLFRISADQPKAFWVYCLSGSLENNNA